jgi:tetratricopeptide (TPR) repeat protein
MSYRLVPGRILLVWLSAIPILFRPECALAQHSVEVQRLQVQGQYLKSLFEYAKIPKKRESPDATIAAAKSAWALSLPERAVEEFERALKMKGLDSLQRAQVTLSEGIVRFQEGEFQLAALYAERAVGMIAPPHAIRSRALLLWGESLTATGNLAGAEMKFQDALQEMPSEEQDGALFRLGNVRMKLGKRDEAREALEAIPTKSDHAPETIRALAQLELDTGNFRRAYQWLVKGQREHAEFFLDGWVHYALMKCAIAESQTTVVEDLQRTAEERFPPSDPWITLLEAAAEAYYWEHVRARPNSSIVPDRAVGSSSVGQLMK